MSASQVLLGVTPTILSILGSSVEESSLLYVVGRRPGLAWILALGSPSVYFSRAFQYSIPYDILRGDAGRLNQHRPQRWWVTLAIVLAEYVLALGSLLNIALLAGSNVQ